MGKGKWSVAQMVATTEKGISQIYERGLKQMENAKTKVEYLQAADVFVSIACSTDPRKIQVVGTNNQYCLKSFALAHKCIELAEQRRDDEPKELLLNEGKSSGEFYSISKDKKTMNIDELCAAMKQKLETNIGVQYGAQRILGNMYYKGEEVPQNYAEAFKWYEKMAEQGNTWAQNLVGLMCFNGTGVQENKDEAKKWLGKAATQGYEPAKEMLRKLGE